VLICSDSDERKNREESGTRNQGNSN
jgi:hypothetical protein